MWEGKSVLTKTDRKCEGCWLVKLGSLLSEPIIILRGMGYTSRNHIKNSSNWVIQNCFHTGKWNPVSQSKIRGAEYINFLLLWKKLPKFDGLKQFNVLFYSFHGLGRLLYKQGKLSMCLGLFLFPSLLASFIKYFLVAYSTSSTLLCIMTTEEIIQF